MSSGPRKPLDIEDVEDVHDALWRILKDRRTLKMELRQKEKKIARLEKELAIAKEFQGRLHQKCMTLEAQPDGVLDAWDEQFLFDFDSVIYFKKLVGGRRRLVLERKGLPRIIRNGKSSEVFLREAVEEASGRKRASPKQEKG